MVIHAKAWITTSEETRRHIPWRERIQDHSYYRARPLGKIPQAALPPPEGIEVGPRSKAARFERPIVAVKEVKFPEGSDKNSYCVVHISFQSTGSTNITNVNVLYKVEIYASQREKGKGGTKRIRDIEMNEGREFYLKFYNGVDKMDQMLKYWGMIYVT